MTYGEISSNFRKYFGDHGGTMGANNSFGLIRGTETVWVRDLKTSKDSPAIAIAHISFDSHVSIVYNLDTGERTFHWPGGEATKNLPLVSGTNK